MNQDHLRAILSQDQVVAVEIAGRTIATEGHIAVAMDWPLTKGRKKEKAVQPLISSWMRWTAQNSPVVVPGEKIYRQSNYITREIGATFIQEAFYQAFAGEGIAFHWDEDVNHPILVRDRFYLVGAVMPLRWTTAPGTPIEPTEQEVFAPFASSANGYYLQGDKVLKADIADLRKEIRDLRRVFKDSQDALADAEEKLAAKEEALRAWSAKNAEVAI